MAKIEVRNLEVSVAAQVDDVAVLVKDVVVTLVKKGDVTSLIPQALKAVDGLKEAFDEVKTQPLLALRSAVLRGLEVFEALRGPKVVNPVAP